jgi:hypothetical protein
MAHHAPRLNHSASARLNRGSDEFTSGVVTDANRVFVSGTAFRPGHNYD